jgi:PAP2 superfamily
MKLFSLILLSITLLLNFSQSEAKPLNFKPKFIVVDKSPRIRISNQQLNTARKLFKRKVSTRSEIRRDFINGQVIYWNSIALDTVAATKTVPPLASRAYALLAIAQNDAIQAARSNGKSSISAATAQASASVLAYIYPNLNKDFNFKKRRSFAHAIKVKHELIERIIYGAVLGRKVANIIIKKAKLDGSNALWTGTVPTGSGFWFSTQNPATPPLLPLWGSVKTWFLSSGSEIRPPAPPPFGSPEYIAALKEVRFYSDNRTSEQDQIAKFWAAGLGTSTPPGMWNSIATSFLVTGKVNEARSARILAAVNMAMMDAGICAWDAKYVYWQLRPSQADPLIKLAVPLPNFPAYTSGHATFSGAASKVLATAFSNQASYFNDLAEEAAISRLYGGIHYRYDNEVGLAGGRLIGDRAAKWLFTNQGLKK